MTISAKHLPETSELEICVVDTGAMMSVWLALLEATRFPLV